MEIALIVRDIGKEDSDGYEKILAAVKITGTVTQKQVNAARPKKDSLVALSRSKFRKAYPARKFPETTWTPNQLLIDWIAAIQNETSKKIIEDSQNTKRYTCQLSRDVLEQITSLAVNNGMTTNELIAKALADFVIGKTNNGAAVQPAVTVAQQYAYAIGRIARLERDLTGKFNPDKYLAEPPREKVRAVKAYAKTELTKEQVDEVFSLSQNMNTEDTIIPKNYGYFMAGFYGLDIGSIG